MKFLSDMITPEQRPTPETDEWRDRAKQYLAEREHNAMMALQFKAERDEARTRFEKSESAFSELLNMADAMREAIGEAYKFAADSKCGSVLAKLKPFVATIVQGMNK